MPEYIRPSEEMYKQAGFAGMLDNTIVRRDLFFLLVMFLADERVAQLSDAICKLNNEFLNEEIIRRLVSTAAILRARDDYVTEATERSGSAGTKSWAAELQRRPCGTLQEDIEAAAVIPLVMREACNKVIHADRYRFDVEGDWEGSYINPLVYLYGSRRQKRWSAVLNIVQYVEVGISYTDFS